MDLKKAFVKATVIVVACAATVLLNVLNVDSIETTLKFSLAASYGVLARASQMRCRNTEELASRMLSMTYLLLAMYGSIVLFEEYFPAASSLAHETVASASTL